MNLKTKCILSAKKMYTFYFNSGSRGAGVRVDIGKCLFPHPVSSVHLLEGSKCRSDHTSSFPVQTLIIKSHWAVPVPAATADTSTVMYDDH